jgi:hypothetical protein
MKPAIGPYIAEPAGGLHGEQRPQMLLPGEEIVDLQQIEARHAPESAEGFGAAMRSACLTAMCSACLMRHTRHGPETFRGEREGTGMRLGCERLEGAD